MAYDSKRFMFMGFHICPECNGFIEAYDYYNNKVFDNYSVLCNDFVHKKIIPNIDRKAIYNFKCISCKTYFPVLWYKGFPIPDSNPLNMRSFLREFKEKSR